MTTYYAFDNQASRCGGLHECLAWAQGRACGSGDIVLIAKARAGEKRMRVLAEATKHGITFLIKPHYLPAKKVRRNHG